MSLPQRTIDEVKARLKLEPEIREIYVEGLFDRDLYRWGLGNLNSKSPIVYPIASINITADDLKKYGLTSGERQRVIAFANCLSEAGDFRKSLMCIIDSDFDYVFGLEHNCPLIFSTTGTSAELLFLNSIVLTKFFEMILGVSDAPEKVKKTLDRIVPTLKSIFILRAAITKLGLDWKIIDIEKEIGKDTEFNFDHYYEKILNKNAGAAHREEVIKEMQKLSDAAEALVNTKKIHGHDFVTALRKDLLNEGVKRKLLHEAEELGRILMGVLEWRTVKDDPIFKALGSF